LFMLFFFCLLKQRRRKLRRDRISIILAAILSRTVYFLICCVKTLKQKYTKLILPLALYRCKTWSVGLREEYRLRVFEISELSSLFRSKWDEVIRGWRKCLTSSFLTYTLC
jgi:hypothetical protein